jgi:hypothetical protein
MIQQPAKAGMTRITFAQLAAGIRGLGAGPGGSRVVGVDGMSGAGKTGLPGGWLRSWTQRACARTSSSPAGAAWRSRPSGPVAALSAGAGSGCRPGLVRGHAAPRHRAAAVDHRPAQIGQRTVVICQPAPARVQGDERVLDNFLGRGDVAHQHCREHCQGPVVHGVERGYRAVGIPFGVDRADVPGDICGAPGRPARGHRLALFRCRGSRADRGGAGPHRHDRACVDGAPARWRARPSHPATRHPKTPG